MKKKKSLYFVGLIIVAVILTFSLRFKREPTHLPGSLHKSNNEGKLPGPSATKEENWRAFREEFGANLVGEFTHDGRLVKIKGIPGEGTTDSEFEPKDREKVKRRAQEILKKAEGVLAYSDGGFTSAPIIQTGPLSAQAYFIETYEGKRVLPGGNIRIDLGPGGEILSLEMNSRPKRKITNQPTLTLEEARSKASEVHAKFWGEAKGKIQKEEQILWTSNEESRWGFEFMISGIQIIIDAATGETLYSRNRRHH